MKNKKRQNWPQKRNCKQCGKEFEINYFGNCKKYCSTKCCNKYGYIRRYKTNWPQKKKCIVCGKEFEVSMHMVKKKYCSRHCAYISFRDRTNPIAKHRILCLHCKKEMITHIRSRKYCSFECQRKYLSRNRSYRPSKAYLEKSYPSYSCQNCGYKFKLNFDPKSEEGKLILKYIKCPKCLSS